MKANFLLFVATFCSISPLLAQVPSIQWQNCIGGYNYETLSDLRQTADGGYILGGDSNSNISGDKTENSSGGRDYWIVKLDAIGAIQWQNTIGGSSWDGLTSLQQTSDGGYILGGFSASNISGDKTENNLVGFDYWVLKLDVTGAIEWQNTIGGLGDDVPASIQQTADGGFIIGGSSDSPISSDKTENNLGREDYWVLKLDATGVIQWQNTIGGDGADILTSLDQTSDGGCILGGRSRSNISGDKTENCLDQSTGDYWVVKLNATGAVQWENTIAGNNSEDFNSLQQTADGGYILGGSSWSNISGDKTENSLGLADIWILKLTANGDIQWQNTIGGNDIDELLSIQQTPEGGYILGAGSQSNISGDKTENCLGHFDYWVLKLDATGGIQWQNTIGGGKTDVLRTCQQTPDGGYILGGYSGSTISDDKTENGNGNFDYWVIKLAPETVPTGEAPTASTGVTIYPNPTSDVLFVSSETTTTLCLHNTFGQILTTQTIQGQGEIDLSRYPNGIYFLMEMETGIGHKILKNE